MLLQLIPQISEASATGEERFFDIGENIGLSVIRGDVDIRLRWTPPNQTVKVFTTRGVYMKHYEFDQFVDMLNRYITYFV